MKSDIWSLGCILYEMITLKPPFQAEDMETLYKKVTKAEYSNIPERYSNDLRDLIRYLLQVDPHKRPSCCTFTFKIERILGMAIVNKRIKNREELYDNPEFLETIRLPTDIYFLTESLPKPNYLTPKKATTGESLKESIKSKYRNRISGNLYKINNNVPIKKEPNNRSYAVNHRTIIEAAREEVKNDRK